MKCTACHTAEPVIKYRGEVPYWYKGHATSIHEVSQYVCPRCGNESIPPGYVRPWLEQTALFRAEINAQEPGQGARPESLKGSVMVEWLTLDPDQLAAEVPLEESAYVRWETLANYAKQHRNAVFEAFAGYKGSHTTDRPACAYRSDWVEFLDALRKAREIAVDPHWESPEDGVVYRPGVRSALTNLFLDCEWADVLASELVSIGLVSADLRHAFYAERDPLPADPMPFVRAAVYPLLERGVVAMPDALLTYRLRTFLAAIPSASIVYDSPHDRALCQFVLDGLDEAEPDGPVPPEIQWQHLELDVARERWWRDNPEHQPRRHHAGVDALALRGAWLSLQP